MKLFWAIALEAETRRVLGEAIAEASAGVDATWVRPEQLHVTVLYVGEATQDEVWPMVAAARGVAVRQRPFSLTVKGGLTFGARVLGFEVGGEVEQAAALAGALAAALEVEPDHPNYVPHVTAARSRGGGTGADLEGVAQRWNAVRTPDFRVGRVTLFDSQSGVYLPVAMVPLGQPLFHLVGREDWARAVAAGMYRPPSLTEAGFVHLSEKAQVVATANRFFRGRDDVLLLQLDATRFEHEVRYEEGEPGILFPHLYGPLAPAAVVSAVPMVRGGDGSFEGVTHLGHG